MLRDFSNYLIPLLMAQLIPKELLPSCSGGQRDISGILGSGHSGFEDEQSQHQDSSATSGRETSQDSPRASPAVLGHVDRRDLRAVVAQLHAEQGRTVGLNPCLIETCSSSQALSCLG